MMDLLARYPSAMRGGYVYILGSDTLTLYIGVTSNLDRRMAEHKSGSVPGFASRHGCTRLLYVEEFVSITTAIAREKELKGKSRAKKLALIRSVNPELRDLAEKFGWLAVGPARSMAEEDARLRSRIRLPLNSSEG